MNMWEGRYIYRHRRPKIKFYRRYIDDVIILWEGATEYFHEDEMNQNKYVISFTGKSDQQQIDYLDLQIFKKCDELHTKTFFKSTDRNGYILVISCHHPKWKENVPKGQLMRLRRNCHNVKDFNVQMNKFIDKGYQEETLTKLKVEIMNMDRNSLLVKRNRSNDSQTDVAFITGFNNQYRSIERIIRKYWPILKSDRILSKILTKKTRFMYNKAPMLTWFIM